MGKALQLMQLEFSVQSGIEAAELRQEKLEQEAATTCNLHMGTYMLRSCAHVQVVLLLHPTPTCAGGVFHSSN